MTARVLPAYDPADAMRPMTALEQALSEQIREAYREDAMAVETARVLRALAAAVGDLDRRIRVLEEPCK